VSAARAGGAGRFADRASSCHAPATTAGRIQVAMADLPDPVCARMET